MIQVRDLQKSYGKKAAVDGVSLDVNRGETFGLLGPNGAGKTTTILMLVGALRPDAGSVMIDGTKRPTEPASRLALGMAPQNLSLYEELSAAENLTFFARLYRLSGAILRERVAWALDFAGLTDRAKDRVKTFSGGMKRRLNLAVALVHDPAVLFLDEPTVGVDPQSRNHIFSRVDELKSRGRTIVYTTHYMEEAQRLCDRVAIMDRGQILVLDTVDALITRHGGHSVVRAELERLPDDTSLLPGPIEGLSLRFESEQPLEEVARMSSAGVAFRKLEVAKPDLEAVFLNLTGRRLRD